jgi:hypothetical protein
MHRSAFFVAVCLFLLFALAGLACRGTLLQNVQNEQVCVALAQADSVRIDSYVPSDRPAAAGILIGLVPGSVEELWQRSARQMAGTGYAVMLLPAREEGDADRSVAAMLFAAGLEALAARCGSPSLPVVLVGIGPAATAAFTIAAQEERVHGVLVISPTSAGADSALPAAVSQMNSRPVVVLESAADRDTDQPALDRLWEMIGEPKKRALLQTRASGAEVISGDLEPVVRRMILLLGDRYARPQ